MVKEKAKINNYHDFMGKLKELSEVKSHVEEMSVAISTKFNGVKKEIMEELVAKNGIDIKLIKEPRKLLELGYTLSSFVSTGEEVITLSKVVETIKVNEVDIINQYFSKQNKH